jgi:antitoxin ParD1/3/4
MAKSDIICHQGGVVMPNVSFTGPMEEYIQRQLKTGAYANVSEVVRAGMRLLMEKDAARQFYALRANLEAAAKEAENGGFEAFNAKTYEPDAFKE